MSKISRGDDALTRVAALERKIEAGANFEDLASQYSEDQSSKVWRGDVGIVFEGSGYDARVVKAALTLRAGQILNLRFRPPQGIP